MTRNQAEPPSTLPSGQKGKRWLAVVVAVIVVAGAFSTFYIVTRNKTSPYHLGTVSGSEVENVSMKPLVKHDTAYSPGKNFTVSNSIVSYYTTNGSGYSISRGYLLFASLEFKTTSEANSFYSYLYNNESAILQSMLPIIEGAYNGFKYFTFYYWSNTSGSSFYEFAAIGHADQYVFVVTDINVPLTNSTALLQDQINAMVG